MLTRCPRPTRLIRLLAPGLILAGCVAHTQKGPGSAPFCLASDDLAEDVIPRAIHYVQAADTSAAAQSISLRAPVSLVRDEAICRALAAENQRAHPASVGARALPVYVLDVGGVRYLVFDQVTTAAGRGVYDVYSREFRYIGGLRE